MKKYKRLFSLLCFAPILAKAETPPPIPPPTYAIDPQFEPPPRNTFFQIHPLPLSVGGGVRYRTEENLKGHEHSFNFKPGINKEFWGIMSYKYSRLTYHDSSPDSNYRGIGFKLGMISHKIPFADIQFIKGWQYASGPFKWGQLEINCLPIAVGAVGMVAFMSSSSGWDDLAGSILLAIGLSYAISFNLAF